MWVIFVTGIRMAQSSLSRKIRGKTVWDIADLYLLAQAFGVSVESLLPDPARLEGLEPPTF